MREDNLVYVYHIRDAIATIHEYGQTHSFEDFRDTEWDQSAIIRYFEIIGEAATKIDKTFRDEHSSIEWRDLSDFRNFLIHDYMDIDVSIVWDAITKDVPDLVVKINNLLAALQK
ncbi:MAG: hypothetical protein COU65_00235 [Candidatus Pacebacteria bacterium CG10_big_fil_rev_8_21_14_0_10_42_12]|nr:DUF86 domain-containing protein [Candidatus Paceibacterota bacterium]PIR63003.1 MAG: hypothetical protein COU65_00235 [Candidatus Pacebacteria bacterium CG10_big_fil_rev_8_21_14_0_10_42_12]